MNWIPWLIISTILLLAIFLPRVGFLAVYEYRKAAKSREQVEDALKHLLDCEQGGRHASPESLAGILHLSRPQTSSLVESMESQTLIESHGDEIHLTTEGNRWALHVVRAHRLWERYLADEARMPLGRIHEVAHRREHSSTDAQLDDLDAALGHPTRDPHGDPIPTREGKIDREGGIPITAWKLDSPARIVHLEDEPSLAYEQILAAGIKLGQEIRILERTPQRVVLSDGENEFRFAESVASNISVAHLPERSRLKREAISLMDLEHDQRAEIVLLDEAVQGFTRRRFLDLGLTPGTIIYPELKNFFGDPRGYRVRGTMIALRKDQAAQIWVKPIS